MISWSQLIKKFLALDVLFGGRSKKIAGINDFGSVLTSTVTFASGSNTITFTGSIPDWLIKDKYFRVTAGGGSNNSSLLRVKDVDKTSGIVETWENLANYSGSVELDGRMWKVINNESIARPTSTGSTMFNVHNRIPTGLEDGSGIALVFAEHYHDEKVDEDDGEMLVHLRNEVGGYNMAADSCSGVLYDIGPLIVVDRNGSVVRARVDNPPNPCFPEEEGCY